MLNYSLEQKTKVICKKGALQLVGEILNDVGYSKALVVHGKNVKATGILDRLEKVLKGANIDYVDYDKVKADPPSEIVNEGGSLCRKEKCDCIIAIGGGSAMDTAKGISILMFNDGNILEYANPKKTVNKCNGLICIPTTSGTGSELSNGLVITDTANSVKVPILATNAMSEYAILDPELTVSMPEDLTVATGLDALSHVSEAYTSILSNPTTDMVCEKMIETIIKYLPIAAKEPTNIIAREKMLIASCFAGWMLAQASAHVGHSIAHVLGGKYHITHGKACAYGYPAMIKHTAKAYTDKVENIGKYLGAKFNENETPEEVGEITARAYKSFVYNTLNLPKIDEYKIPNEDKESIAGLIEKEVFASLCPEKVTYASALTMVNEIINN